MSSWSDIDVRDKWFVQLPPVFSWKGLKFLNVFCWILTRWMDVRDVVQASEESEVLASDFGRHKMRLLNRTWCYWLHLSRVQACMHMETLSAAEVGLENAWMMSLPATFHLWKSDMKFKSIIHFFAIKLWVKHTSQRRPPLAKSLSLLHLSNPRPLASLPCCWCKLWGFPLNCWQTGRKKKKKKSFEQLKQGCVVNRANILAFTGTP